MIIDPRDLHVKGHRSIEHRHSVTPPYIVSIIKVNNVQKIIALSPSFVSYLDCLILSIVMSKANVQVIGISKARTLKFTQLLLRQMYATAISLDGDALLL